MFTSTAVLECNRVQLHKGHIPQQFELFSSNNLQVYTYRCVCVCVCVNFLQFDRLRLQVFFIEHFKARAAA